MDSVGIAVLISVIAGLGMGISVLLIRVAIKKVKSSIVGKIINGISSELAASNQTIFDIDFRPVSEPRSISDLSSALLPTISRDFPDLNIRQLISACENLLCESLNEIMHRSSAVYVEKEREEDALFFSGTENVMLPLRVTDSYKAQILRKIDVLRNKGQSEYFENSIVHRTGINKYEKNAGTCAITFQTALEYLHYIKQNDSVISGSISTVEQARYNLQVIYVMDESKLPMRDSGAFGMVCPNCGAAVRSLGNRSCEFCGVALKGVDVRLWRADRLVET
jgi:hypothetical protein